MNRYDNWVAKTSAPLNVLALIFLGDFLLGWLITPGPPWWQPTLTVVSWAVWAAFAIDYLVRLGLHQHRWEFIRTHPVDLLIVLVPMLRLLRVGLILLKAFRSISVEQIAGSLIVIVVAIGVLGALLEWKVEHNAPDANITTIGTAFWWAIVTTTTVGYGDTYPVTVPGRIIGAVMMVVGIGLIGTVSATIAAWFIAHKKPRTRSSDRTAKGPSPAGSATTEQTIATLTATIESLGKQQQQLRALLEQLTTNRAGPSTPEIAELSGQAPQ